MRVQWLRRKVEAGLASKDGGLFDDLCARQEGAALEPLVEALDSEDVGVILFYMGEILEEHELPMTPPSGRPPTELGPISSSSVSSLGYLLLFNLLLS